ncbi:MAG: restriction endonuclease subunit S [Polyangia bacterium]
MSDARRGYKRTEVGVIPEDWEVKPLRQISPAQSVGLVINPSTYFDDKGTVPMLVGSNVAPNRISWESARRITTQSNAALSASRLAAGDLVTVRVGEPGITAVVPECLHGCNCASMMIVRQHRSFNSQWLCHVMNSASGLAQVEHVQYGTAQKQFNISDAVNFSYQFPPLQEQEAIAQALSDADALIESLEQLLTKKRQVKQGAMQELLTGKRRLPGFKDKWSTQSLEQISAFITKGSTPTTYGFGWTDSGVTFLRSECVSEHGLDLNEAMFISSGAHRLLRRSEVRAGDILMTITGNVGRVIILDPGFPEANINQHIARIRISAGHVDPRFVFHMLTPPGVRSYYNSITTGQAYPQISLAQVRSTEISIPPLTEQTAIATVLSDMDADIAALETKLAKAYQLKQGMMQELLTGKTRLV